MVGLFWSSWSSFGTFGPVTSFESFGPVGPFWAPRSLGTGKGTLGPKPLEFLPGFPAFKGADYNVHRT